ncbi:uncharacterized protein FIBRA_08387 [Fibroporia radiculosa]|uniref:Nuclear pore complex protein Nup85 n=1 Tax=Fibroporia radiculosa TaxID=599839 RepID=J4I2N0_9APHY|nr:uncharacterized protein FIBRA_08387 [Fibroporia radiculosa]CCM06137.1 predicted protein [Fibroporia radiculosa]
MSVLSSCVVERVLIMLKADPNGLRMQDASSSSDQRVYLAKSHHAPTSERRLFVTDTSIIFAAMQNLVQRIRRERIKMLDDEECVKAISKLVTDYINFCKECCIYCSQPIARSEPLQYNAEHYRKLYTCFSLFSVLYLPDHGREHAPVGEELMEWLNTHYVEPTTEEGDHLSSLERPWEDETFWPYLTRSVNLYATSFVTYPLIPTRATIRGLSKASSFFLDVLARHPSPTLQKLSQQLIPLLTGHPRLHQFAAERDFAIAARRWRDKVKSLRLELDKVPEDDREDGFENWWDRLCDIAGILEGRVEVIKKLCLELGADWKEVCIAWGIFVDPRLRRQDLPEVVSHILDDMPSDPTNLEDMMHSSLFLGSPAQALSDAAQIDVWLAAHLADVLEPLQLIDDDPDDSDLTLREQYVLSYTEYLRSDPALWRITVDYMCACGDVGKETADQVLMRVPLRLQIPKDATASDEESARIRTGNLAGVLKEINATCFEHQREKVRRIVCRIAAQTFLQEKDYGLAVSYCVSAEDWTGLGRIVDRVLDEYVVQGPEKYARYVANIAPSLQTLRSNSGANGVFVHRLMFAVRFAEFHQRRMQGELHDAAFDLATMFREDIAPKSWWAVLLSDAVELLLNSETMLFSSQDACLLLHKLEEICIRSGQGSKADYLTVLARTTKSGEEAAALQRLQTVRLALARYYARCGVIDVGGRTAMATTY